MKHVFSFSLLAVWIPAFCQISYNANTINPPVYTRGFLYGSNMGYYGSNWQDESIAEIAAGNPAKSVPGVGVRTLRPTLPEHFLETWGYTVRVNTFGFYDSLGIKDHTVFLEGPSTAHRDTSKYGGCTSQSKVFANLYLPIWDGGANGTPVNENNYYAMYVYKTVTLYKNYVKFWEIWNEPDFDGGANGWKSSGQPGNWFDANPGPCELQNLKASVFQYNRMLRISYEVAKYVDPNCYVTTGGLGYPGFLDAILRNTDNPVDGSVTSNFPEKGGAYFDVLSYHKYPYFDLQTNRHSDAAANVLADAKNDFQTVLTNYGYGTTYPNKLWIITEGNIPRRAIGSYIGGDDVQKNFLIKSLVLCQKKDIKQFYVFTVAEGGDINSTDPNNMMGLYERIDTKTAYHQVVTKGGIGYKTTSYLLGGHTYDAAKTASLGLSSNINGGAFKNSAGGYVYVLWAKTNTDQSEIATATFSFPTAANVSALLSRAEWDFSSTNYATSVSSQSIVLSGSPSFFVDGAITPDPNPITAVEEFDFGIKLTVFPNPVVNSLFVTYELIRSEKVAIDLYDAKGKLVFAILNNRLQAAGIQTMEMKFSDLKEGTYFCKFQIGDKMVVKKILKLN